MTEFALVPFLLISLVGNIVSQSKPAVVVHSDSYTGVIFPAEKKAFQSEFEGEDLQFWTPSEADVQIAESQLPGFLQAMAKKDFRTAEILKKLKTYTRQYAGIIPRGEKKIYMNFFCVLDGPKDSWITNEVTVSDGGDCFFSVWFSIKTRKFSWLIINGVA